MSQMIRSFVSRLEVPELSALVEEIGQHLERREVRQAVSLMDRACEVLARGRPEAGGLDQEVELRLARIELNLQLGRWSGLEEEIQAVLTLGGGVSDRRQPWRAGMLGARLAGYRSQLERAERYLEGARVLAEERADRADLALVLLELGALHQKLGQKDKGQRELDRCRSLTHGVILEEATAPLFVGLALEDGLAAFRRGGADEARRHYEQALAIARQHLPRSGAEADAYRQLGIVASVQGRYLEALRNYERAIELYREQASPLGQAKVYGSIGQACLELSRTEEALFALHRAHKLASRVGADSEKAALYGKLGTIYRDREEYDKAVEFHLKDLELARRFGNERSLAFAFRNLGLSYQARGETEEARGYLLESLTRFQELGDQAREVRVRLELAELAISLKHFDDARDQLTAVAPLLVDRSNPQAQARYHLLQGVLHREQARRLEAGREMVQAMESLSGQSPSILLVQVHLETARLYLGMADQDQAVAQLKLALTLSRQLGLARLSHEVMVLLEQVNDLAVIHLLVEDVERESAGAARSPWSAAGPR